MNKYQKLLQEFETTILNNANNFDYIITATNKNTGFKATYNQAEQWRILYDGLQKLKEKYGVE